MTAKMLIWVAALLVAIGVPVSEDLFGGAVAAQTPATQSVMREKLGHSKSILEAIMTSNYDELERHTVALSRITQSAGWWVLQSPEYRLQSSAFLRTAQDLVEAAKRRDLDEAMKAYDVMVQRCYECHKYMKGRRIATPAR
jgi:hypothetical protein